MQTTEQLHTLHFQPFFGIVVITGLRQKVWYPLSQVSHTSILLSSPGCLHNITISNNDNHNWKYNCKSIQQQENTVTKQKIKLLCQFNPRQKDEIIIAYK